MSGSTRRAAASSWASPCPSCKIRAAGGAKAMPCFSSMPDKPSYTGTGSEDYFLGAWDFGGSAFAYPLSGAPVVGKELAGGRWKCLPFSFRLAHPLHQIHEGHHRAWARQRRSEITIPSPTGIKPSLTRRTRRCPLSNNAFLGSMP